MSRELLTRPLPRAVICIALGLGTGVGMDALFNALTTPASEQIAQSESCVKALGAHAVISEAIPPGCQDALDQNTFSYTSGSNTYYLLPSATTMAAQERSIPATSDEQYKISRYIAEGSGGIAGGILFGGLTVLSRCRRKELEVATPN